MTLIILNGHWRDRSAHPPWGCLVGVITIVATSVIWPTTVIAGCISVIAGPVIARPVVVVIFNTPLLGGNRTANCSNHRSHDRQSRSVTSTVVPATAGAEISVTARRRSRRD